MSELIVPYCIFYKDDFETGTHLAYIAPAEPVLNKDETQDYKCITDFDLLIGTKNWVRGPTIYGFSTDLNPLPHGTLRYKLVQNESFPYQTKDLAIQRDIFNLDPTNDYLVTYNTPIHDTQPLYIFKNDDSIYPTLNQEPPMSHKGTPWSSTPILTLYVMTKKHQKFSCENGRCMPTSLAGKGQNFLDCYIQCNMIVPKELNLTTSLVQKDMKKRNIFKNVSKPVIAVVLTLFIISLIVTIVLLLKLNN